MRLCARDGVRERKKKRELESEKADALVRNTLSGRLAPPSVAAAECLCVTDCVCVCVHAVGVCLYSRDW